jgi:hypothetical protein
METRWRIVDDTGKIIDDAQGYGYRSKAKAHAANWYKSGGRKQQRHKQDSARKWLKKYPEVKPIYLKLTEINAKELISGELKPRRIFARLVRDLGMPIPEEVRWYLRRCEPEESRPAPIIVAPIPRPVAAPSPPPLAVVRPSALLAKIGRTFRKADKPEASPEERAAFLESLIALGIPVAHRSSGRMARVLRGERTPAIKRRTLPEGKACLSRQQ